jgi:hypothetical protein
LKLLLDIAESFDLPPDTVFLPQALVAVNAFLEARGRTLQAVIVDGRPIPPERLAAELRDKQVHEVSTLEVRSATAASLVIETIDEVAEVLPELPVACQQLSAVIAGEAPEEGFKPFNDLLEIWETLEVRQRQAGDLLGVGLGEIEVGGESVQRHRAAVRALLARARNALENSDFIGLSQLLAYELSDHAEREQDIMAALRLRAVACE